MLLIKKNNISASYCRATDLLQEKVSSLVIALILIGISQDYSDSTIRRDRKSVV